MYVIILVIFINLASRAYMDSLGIIAIKKPGTLSLEEL